MATRLVGMLAGTLLACGEPQQPPSLPQAEPEAPPAVQPAAQGDCLARADALPELDRGVARALCSELRAHEVPAASLAIAVDGAIVLRFAHGTRCLGAPASVDVDTAFRIGSITKAITAATAYAIDVELDRPLDATLGQRIGAPAGFTPTLRALLDHTAGLGDVLPSEALRGLEPREQVRALVGVPSTTSAWRYANGGYALAGAWLAEHGGAPWSTLVAREVLAPLHMDDARAGLPAPVAGDVACGHMKEGARWIAYDVATDWERFAFGVEAAAPSGAVVASAEDLVRFALALSERPPADAPAWTRTMLAAVRGTEVTTGRAPGERYGSGVVVEPLPPSATLLRHSGQTGDFAAELAWVPERGLAVAILSNNGAPLKATLAAAMQRMGMDPSRER